jgi:hypothetical protein
MVRTCAPENLEIPGLLLTHHPGMTGFARQFIVGIENSAPSFTPDGQREVTVLVLV